MIVMIESILLPALVIGGIGLLFGLGLSFVSKTFAVPVSDVRIEKIANVLPDVNCGACGYSSCAAYAEAVVDDKEKCTLCTVGGDKVSKRIMDIMGLDESLAARNVARIHCGGDRDAREQKYEYEGVQTCAAAAKLHAGPLTCRFGCIGLGDCALACPVNAIATKNGLAYVMEEKCVGCGLCVKTCPKNLITMLTCENRHSVVCHNTDRGAGVRKICSKGCIGCTRCVKVCKQNAITMKKGLAVINPDACTNCGDCVPVCPTDSIHDIFF